jgi:CBS domain-containing protein
VFQGYLEAAMSDETMRTEEHRVSGERLVSRVKELIHQGNVRRVIVKNDDGETILEIPLTLGVVGAVLLPSLVALGAIAALAADYTVVVQKEADKAVVVR